MAEERTERRRVSPPAHRLGMGAFSLLSRRLDMARAERFLASGRQYSAAELYDMGVVDVLAEDGEGVQAVNAFVRRHSRSSNGLLAIRQVRQRIAPLTYEELDDVVMMWVDAALRLTDRDLRTMERLVAAQHKLAPPQRCGRFNPGAGHQHHPVRRGCLTQNPGCRNHKDVVRQRSVTGLTRI